MNSHLTSDEISAFVSGLAGSAHNEHVRDCPQCRAEVENLGNSLVLFRESVREWSAEREPAFAARPSRLRVRFHRFAWAAVLAACLIAALTIPRGKVSRPVPPQQTISDADLLGRVNSQLSEAVPAPLMPVALQKSALQKSE